MARTSRVLALTMREPGMSCHEGLGTDCSDLEIGALSTFANNQNGSALDPRWQQVPKASHSTSKSLRVVSFQWLSLGAHGLMPIGPTTKAVRAASR